MSKAFFKSMNTPIVHNLLSREAVISSTSSVKAKQVDMFSVNPYLVGLIPLYVSRNYVSRLLKGFSSILEI